MYCDINMVFSRVPSIALHSMWILSVLVIVGAIALEAHTIPKIVGGVEAYPGEFPHQVALLVDGAQLCGGSLLAKDLVVTAGHCCEGSDTMPCTNTLTSYMLLVKFPASLLSVLVTTTCMKMILTRRTLVLRL